MGRLHRSNVPKMCLNSSEVAPPPFGWFIFLWRGPLFRRLIDGEKMSKKVRNYESGGGLQTKHMAQIF